jgi:hypothetical protein
MYDINKPYTEEQSMVTHTKWAKLRKVVDRLADRDFDRVLDFAQLLKRDELPPGASGAQLADLAGSLSEQDADQMNAEIERAFERVDPNEWQDPA